MSRPANRRESPGHGIARRRGLSLLEVVLATAILGGALVVISNLNYLGGRSAINAIYFSEGQIIADATMAELAAGVIPPQNASGNVVDFPEWNYSIEIVPAEHTGLLLAKVTVTLSATNGPSHRPIELWRLIPDPNYEPEEAVLQ